MNKVILVGRLTRDPEIRAAGTTTVAKFSLAVDRRFKREGEPDADFFNCTAFGKQAEFVERYLRRGMDYAQPASGFQQNNDFNTQAMGRPQPSQAVADDFMSIPDSVDELPFGTN